MTEESRLGQKETERLRNGNSFLCIAGIVMISLCLRGPITTVGPLAGQIQEELHISGSVFGVVTTLPLLAFGLFSACVGALNRRAGTTTLIAFGLVGIAAGGALRCLAGVAGLMAGTLVMGLGIAVGNVLIPSIIREWFPARVGTLTGVYTLSMGCCATLGAGMAVPISTDLGLGWRTAFGLWSIPAAAAIALWLFASARRPRKAAVRDLKNEGAPASEETKSGGSVWHSRTAWCIMAFMGMQSLLFYSITSWMPTIVKSMGVTERAAGMLALVFQLASLPMSFFIPILAEHIRRQEWLGMAIGVGFLGGIAGVFCSGGNLTILAISLTCASMASGGAISWVLAMIGTKGSSQQETAELSGMAQSGGYLLAAVGPALSGMVFDYAGSWNGVLLFYMAAAAAVTVFGFLVGRYKTL